MLQSGQCKLALRRLLFPAAYTFPCGLAQFKIRSDLAMKKTTSTSDGKTSARLLKMENKVRRAEMKLANTEAKLIKRKAKLAAAREAYEAMLAADAEIEQPASEASAVNSNGADSDDD
jgi:2C-methyl-D-erythritol 2,4-cyclodiphosphate synthase